MDQGQSRIRIEKLRAEITRLRDQETEAQRALQVYLDGLEVA